MKSTVTLLLLFFCVQLHAQNKPLAQRIDSLLEASISESDAGLFVGVVQNGKIIYEGYRGLANLEHQVPVSEKTRSNIASTAKQFIALMVLDLSQKGKLSLEEDVRKYIPSIYPKVEDNIKIRHLLNHTAGVRDIYDLLSIQNKPWWKQVGFDNEDAIALVEQQEELAFTPGSYKMYSNSGYLLLTRVIEKASGQDFHEYANAFFKQLGMENTQFQKNYMLVIPNLAKPYIKWGQNSPWKQYPMLTNLYGDGFLFTTLPDQLNFERVLQNAEKQGNELLLMSQQPIPNSEIQTYGFGLKLFNRLNYPAVHHDGSTGAYHSETLRFPEEQLTIFAMGNNGNQWSGWFTTGVAKMILPKRERPENYDQRLNILASITATESFTGQFLSSGNYLIRIEENEGKYSWHNANNRPIELVQGEGNTLRFTDGSGEILGFEKDKMYYFYPDGKVREYSRLAVPQPSLADLGSYTGTYSSTELQLDFSIELKDQNLFFATAGDEPEEMDVVNRDEILASDYILKVQRDAFDRVVALRLTTNRVQNILFTKKTNLQY